MNCEDKKHYLFNFLGIFSSLIIWEIFVFMKHDVSFPHFYKIANEFFNILFSKEFVINVYSTLKIVFLGLLFSFLFGFLFAFVSAMNKKFSDFIYPVIHTLRNIPSITLYPFIILFLGVDDISRMFIIVWSSFPPIFIETYTGLNSVDKSVIEAGFVSGTSNLQNMIYLKLPLSFPFILTGLRIGLGNGFVAVVVAEMLGATKGLGFQVLWSTNIFCYEKMYSYIFIIGIIGFIFESLLNNFVKHIKEVVL